LEEHVHGTWVWTCGKSGAGTDGEINGTAWIYGWDSGPPSTRRAPHANGPSHDGGARTYELSCNAYFAFELWQLAVCLLFVRIFFFPVFSLYVRIWLSYRNTVICNLFIVELYSAFVVVLGLHANGKDDEGLSNGCCNDWDSWEGKKVKVADI